ncbi:hypothetical protein V7S43_012663 [Phytophthora oleae]|uniref:Ribosomal protein S10 domain-containing protein n=1 Tax=Phytophthora oleae TaxID=2107226 RepID=A0ABD3F9G5_9STRA
MCRGSMRLQNKPERLDADLDRITPTKYVSVKYFLLVKSPKLSDTLILQYLGAFPALCQKITPRSVRFEKLQAKRALAATFGIVPVPPAAGIGSTVATLERPARFRSPKTIDSAVLGRKAFTGSLDIPLETTRLAPALTPRNVYENPKNRQFVLAMRLADQPRNSESPQ